ncbi:MAG: hypothetical protein JWO03_759 [Bacteroidetes bacterium]|nr:hypothetical protein [Bacteroidota bacterium]
MVRSSQMPCQLLYSPRPLTFVGNLRYYGLIKSKKCGYPSHLYGKLQVLHLVLYENAYMYSLMYYFM